MKFGIYPIMALPGSFHKQVVAPEVLEDAIEQGIDTISVISTGNYVSGIAKLLQERQLQRKINLVNLVNKLSTNLGARGLLWEEVLIEDRRILRDSTERANYVKEHLQNAGKVKDYTDFTPEFYRYLAITMASFSHLLTKLFDPCEREQIHSPDYIVLGVGSGNLFLALADRIKRDKLRTKLIGVVPADENGIFNEHNLVERKGLLYYKTFSPQTIASKLACPYTSFKQELLESRNDGHLFYEADNSDFESAFSFANSVRCKGDISSAAGLVLYDPKGRKKLELREDASTLLIHSGSAHGSKWSNVFEN